LADFLTEETVDTAFFTATELARQVGVDPATVVRFSQELGYSGYRELSREIKAYVRDQIKGTLHQTQMSTETAEMLGSLAEYKREQLKRFFAVGAPNVAEAVEIILSSRRLWAMAEGAAITWPPSLRCSSACWVSRVATLPPRWRVRQAH